jgi:hypothetical protein
VPDKASFVQAVAVVILRQLDATFALRRCLHFRLIPAMKIPVAKQDKFLPKIDLKNPRKITMSGMGKFYTAICAGKWTPAAKGQPDWAFRALGEFCRLCRGGLHDKSFGERPKPPKLPTLCSTLEVIRTNPIPQILLTFKNRKDFKNFFPSFCGQAVPFDLPVPNIPTEFCAAEVARVYLIIFLEWQEIASLKTVPNIHKWLIRMKAINPDPPDKDMSRYTRRWLKCIGFPLQGAGRPKRT